MEALGRLFSLKNTLLNDLRFDYIFFDTSPGLQYSSINAIVAADVVLVVMSPDKSDVEGTQRMIRDLYELFEKKTGVVVNKVPIERVAEVARQVNPTAQPLPVIGVVPCSCDVLAARGKCVFASEKPDHPFTRKLREIAASLADLKSCDTDVAVKPVKLEKCSCN